MYIPSIFGWSLNSYGLLAISSLLVLKEAGLPFPIPSEVLFLAMAAGAAQGRYPLFEAFLAALVPAVIGECVQFLLVRGPGRHLVHRITRWIGLNTRVLLKVEKNIRKMGAPAVGIGLLTPGVRAAVVPSAGLARLSLAEFVPAMIASNTLYMGLTFFLMFTGISIARLLGPLALVGGTLLILVGFSAFVLSRAMARKAPGRAHSAPGSEDPRPTLSQVWIDDEQAEQVAASK